MPKYHTMTECIRMWSTLQKKKIPLWHRSECVCVCVLERVNISLISTLSESLSAKLTAKYGKETTN